MANDKLGRASKERLAVLRNQVSYLLWHGKIETTAAKAKAVASKAEKILTLAINSYQDNVTVKKTVSVKKGKKLVLKAKLAWTLKSNKGKSLKGKKIVFKFKGKKYTAKTNSKGVAKVTIKTKVTKKLKAGKKYSFSATYLKNTVK